MRQRIVAAALAGAFLVTLCPARGLAQAPKTALDSPVSVALAHFHAGQKLYYADKLYEKALAEFRASYEATPSPNSRLYIARCLREMGQIAAAYDELSQVILEAADRMATDPKYQATQKAASEERALLKDRVATLVVEMPADVPGAKLYVGADEVPAARWSGEITVASGAVRVRAEAEGRRPFERSITISAGQRERITAELPPAPGEAPGPAASRLVMPGYVRPLAYATAGVGVVGFVLWGALGIKAASRYDDLKARCAGRCGPEHQRDIDAGRVETAVSRAGLGIGILGVLGGATLWTLDQLGRRPDPSSGSITFRFRIAASPLETGAFVEGSF